MIKPRTQLERSVVVLVVMVADSDRSGHGHVDGHDLLQL